MIHLLRASAQPTGTVFISLALEEKRPFASGCVQACNGELTISHLEVNGIMLIYYDSVKYPGELGKSVDETVYIHFHVKESDHCNLSAAHNNQNDAIQ